MASLVAVVVTTAIAAGLWWNNTRIEYPPPDSGSVISMPGVTYFVLGAAWMLLARVLDFHPGIVVLWLVQALAANEPLRRKQEGDS